MLTYITDGRNIVYWVLNLLIKGYEDLPDLHQEFWSSPSRPLLLRY